MMRLLPLGLLLIGALQAADWPRFRGPNGSGVDSSTGLPTEFGPSKNLLWRAAVPFGRSSPIVAGARVFLTASEGETRITLAYDALTGRELWRRELKCDQAHKVFRTNDPASPTPAADDHGIYVFFPDFGLISYTYDGEERWRHSLGPFNNFYGMATSPVVSARPCPASLRSAIRLVSDRHRQGDRSRSLEDGASGSEPRLVGSYRLFPT